MENVSYTITPKTLVLFINGKNIMISRQSETEKANTIIDLLKKKDYAAIKSMLTTGADTIKQHFGENYFKIDGSGTVLVDEIAVHDNFAKKILQFAMEKLPVDPLINFWRNLRENPSTESIADLYDFLQHNGHPITEDGCFLAYKKVSKTGDGLVDSHTKTMANNPGRVVRMDRRLVNANRNETCSTGLHVASWKYAQGFSGTHLIVTKINPRDVVSVPVDYNQEKMRVCEYEVLSVYGETAPIEKTHIPTNEVKSTDEWDSVKNYIQGVVEELVYDQTYTGNQIVDLLYKNTGERITTNLKDKTSIIKKAYKIIFGEPKDSK